MLSLVIKNIFVDMLFISLYEIITSLCLLFLYAGITQVEYDGKESAAHFFYTGIIFLWVL